MPKQKTLAELNAEKEKIKQQLAQEQHKKQRLENRIAYYERGRPNQTRTQPDRSQCGYGKHCPADEAVDTR